MVRRITMEEAAADFKGIVERALENGDSLELDRNGQVVATVTPPPGVRPVGNSGSRELFEALDKLSPVDDSFATDIEAGRRSQPAVVPKGRWDD